MVIVVFWPTYLISKYLTGLVITSGCSASTAFLALLSISSKSSIKSFMSLKGLRMVFSENLTMLAFPMP